MGRVRTLILGAAAVIRHHPEWGQELVRELGGFPAEVKRLVMDHHERLDGIEDRVLASLPGPDPRLSRRGPAVAGGARAARPAASTGIDIPEVSRAEEPRRHPARRVHRVFVLDKTGALVGVVSSLDILRTLCD